ncbi:RNA-binding S4 domain-containing protein [Bacteriovoracaceae bacterium]|nr:RNA-binding S4 domain-containing protein [Bacteriovoracaceae bacterium]
MNEFKLKENEFIKLCDLLKKVSWCSTGGHAKLVIDEGQVKVNDEVELRKRYKLKLGDVVEFENQFIKIT